MESLLLLHNRYRHPGGEDVCVEEETRLLTARGHAVALVEADNRTALQQGSWATLRALLQSCNNPQSAQLVHRALQETRPDWIHIHNLWFTLGLSALRACRDAPAPVMMTLHNLRFLCPGGSLLRPDGTVCSTPSCAGGIRCLSRRCYHQSAFATWAATRMTRKGWKERLWQDAVDLYAVPSAFVRTMILGQGLGLQPEQVRILPHTCADPLASGRKRSPQSPVPLLVYAGRLSGEKGVRVLLEAWRMVHDSLPEARLLLLGDGPLQGTLREAFQGLGVEFAGRCPREGVGEHLHEAWALVQPSLCLETFGLTLLEALARGRPVVASSIGALPELAREGETGLLVPPGDAGALARAILTLLRDGELRNRMGECGRALYEREFNEEQGYRNLCDAFALAKERSARRLGAVKPE